MDTSLDIGCRSCGATYHVPERQRSVTCPYCDSPAVVERPSSDDRPDPAFVLPFVLDETSARDRVQAWLKRAAGLFRPSGLARAALGKTRSMYLPAWLYGAVADSAFRADIGEKYTKSDSNGHTTTYHEWHVLEGRRTVYLKDVLVSASAGLPNAELEAIEPYQLSSFQRYRPVLLAGWAAEDPSRSLDECREEARQESLERVNRELPGFLPGDRQRNLQHRTHLNEEVTDLVLLPIWIFAARYHEKKPPVRIVVNGQTGEIHGKVPVSWPKVLAATIIGAGLLIALVLGLAWLDSQGGR
ncbi:MAG: hypothetical protein AAF533_16775 [Acidobacteriota bacterium]